jgi:hypothetical protein
MIGLGTLLNIAAIGIGSAIGVFAGNRLRIATRDLITQVLGFTTVLAAVDAVKGLWEKSYTSALPRGWSLLVLLFALLLAAILGSWLGIEARLDSMGIWLREKFSQGEESNFLEGFITATLIFAIGPLAILGSMSDGMRTGIAQLILKSTLDFFAAMAFASTLGWGVAASIIPVGIYQGVWTAVGWFAGSILADYQIAAMTISGGILLLAIAMRLLKLKDVAVGNLLPVLVVAPLLATAAHAFN